LIPVLTRIRPSEKLESILWYLAGVRMNNTHEGRRYYHCVNRLQLESRMDGVRQG
jgi:hypothetical protein